MLPPFHFPLLSYPLCLLSPLCVSYVCVFMCKQELSDSEDYLPMEVQVNGWGMSHLLCLIYYVTVLFPSFTYQPSKGASYSTSTLAQGRVRIHCSPGPTTTPLETPFSVPLPSIHFASTSLVYPPSVLLITSLSSTLPSIHLRMAFASTLPP